MKNYKDKKWIQMSVEELTTPHDGRICYVDYWWVVTPENTVVFFQGYWSPQCNRIKEITERLMGENCKAVLIPLAYVPQQ